MAQSLDNTEGGQDHRQALDAGLMALEEADAFAPDGSLPSVSLDLKRIVAGHQTPVLKDVDLKKITPLMALQQYYAFAQERLTDAGGQEPVVSRTLYRMGRLQMVMSGGLDGRRTLGGPKAMALYKAALKVDAKNYIAANQLGVLLARYGQPDEARRVLMHSLSVSPQPETFHNLVVVNRTLGNDKAARQAQAQYQQQLAAAQRLRKAQSDGGDAEENTQVHWVSAAAFTRMPNADAAEALHPAASLAGPTEAPEGEQPKPVATKSKKDKDVAKKGYEMFKPFFWR
jgi:tetratricopeptide (TPR) repeat protein